MLPANHPPVAFGRVAVLLVNLGTPDAPTPQAVKRYLGEFLSDRRVVELPALLWQPILRGIILNTRPRKVAKNYAAIWDKEANASPLRVITAEQTAAVRDWLGDKVVVDYAMRYGNPSIAARLQALKAQGCDRILIAPLYPQYSQATTGTVQAAVFEAIAKMRWQPALRFLPAYHDAPAYIAALAEDMKAQLAALDFTPDVVLASFHGMPRATLDKGDPYHCHCHKTARLLREALGMPAEKFRLTFQSRFGRAQWLQPYTDATLAALPGEGVRKIAVVSPGFSADCLETLEEIAMGGKETFLHAGGTHYAYLPCLNARPLGVRMLKSLLSQELAGWLDVRG